MGKSGEEETDIAAILKTYHSQQFDRYVQRVKTVDVAQLRARLAAMDSCEVDLIVREVDNLAEKLRGLGLIGNTATDEGHGDLQQART